MSAAPKLTLNAGTGIASVSPGKWTPTSVGGAAMVFQYQWHVRHR